MDKIIIKGLKLYAYHGVNPEEKEAGQMFILDITCFVSLCVPCKTDCVDDTVSYAKILKTARAAFLSDKFDLLEKAAECVATVVLNQFAPVQAVTVCVKKPQAPMKADFDYVAVEITRERLTDTAGETEE
ncbi:MAG: dihydroneopterin aldolase [Candidatus Fimenecus sp.]